MAKARIMVVEDEFITAKALITQLESMGYEIASHVKSGDEAVDRAVKERPDLILMDIVMPGKIDGIEAARRIREKVRVPVVFLTAYSDDETIERAKVTEPYGYILKPFTERDLYISIEMALHKDRAEKDPQRSWKHAQAIPDFDPDLL